MDVQTTFEKYKLKGDYFAPDYERDNDILIEFKKLNPTLSELKTNELIYILRSDSDIMDKYFVADLLYLYKNFDLKLFEPLLNTAIECKDPSFNRIFIRPVIRVFGLKIVADFLADKFVNSNIEEKIHITKLIYWLRPNKNGETDKLKNHILERAIQSTNLIELYHYKLCYPNLVKSNKKIPENANDLIKSIKGNIEYEDLLFNKLGWRNN